MKIWELEGSIDMVQQQSIPIQDMIHFVDNFSFEIQQGQL